MKKLLLTSLIAAPLLTGCVVAVSDGEVETGWGESKSSWKVRHENNRAAIAGLETGVSYQAILNKLGTPDFSENLQVEDSNYQVLFYATQSLHSDSKTTRDECTPLVFKDKILTGWGETAYQRLK